MGENVSVSDVKQSDRCEINFDMMRDVCLCLEMIVGKTKAI